MDGTNLSPVNLVQRVYQVHEGREIPKREGERGGGKRGREEIVKSSSNKNNTVQYLH